jgi:hypothetical protein
MRGAIPPLPQETFMVWSLVKHRYTFGQFCKYYVTSLGFACLLCVPVHGQHLFTGVVVPSGGAGGGEGSLLREEEEDRTKRDLPRAPKNACYIRKP